MFIHQIITHEILTGEAETSLDIKSQNIALDINLNFPISSYI